MAQLNQIPTSLEPIGSLGNKPVTVSPVWYKFFTSLSGVVANLVGGVLGFTLNPAVTAAGATQGTATKLNSEWSVVTVTPLNGGVMLNSYGPGAASTVFNQGVNTLKVYPTVGSQIDALGVNQPYLLIAGKSQVFSQTANGQWLSLQLG